MAFEKTSFAHTYSPITRYEDSTSDSQDSFVHHEETNRSRSHRRYTRCGIALIILLVLAAYTGLVIFLTSAWWKGDRLRGAQVIETPLRPWIRYQAKTFPKMEWSNEYPLVGMPSDELDARWSALMSNFYAEVPYEYMENLGRLNEGIRLENGNFATTYSVMHILHCVKRLHQSYFPDRYLPNMTAKEQELELEHNLHCLHMLIEHITCNVDIVPFTAIWLNNTILPSGNTDIAHECVDWELMMRGMKEMRVDPFVHGRLVHPTFGPVVLDGRKTVLEDRIGYGHMGKILRQGEDGEWS